MSSRRVPLAENPSAVNSPFRSAASKRLRLDGDEHSKQGSPPKKRQAIGNGSRPITVDLPAIENRAARERRLAAEQASRSRAQTRSTQPPEDNGSTKGTSKEALRTWRKHFLSVFPKQVFYLESLPTDVAQRASRHIAHLGAKEVKFFSRDVTHVVTNRSIPNFENAEDDENVNPAGDPALQRQNAAGALSANRTINPSLLERSNTSLADQAITQRRHNTTENAANQARAQSYKNDILYRAQTMNMKIWRLEKFHRVLDVLLHPDDSTDEEQPATTNTRPQPTAKNRMLRASKDADLSKLLARERINTTVEKQPWTGINVFQDLYIYVHDMNERTKPTLVREYSRPERKEDGDWPRLHSVGNGRCPFVEDPNFTKREQREKELEIERQMKLKEQEMIAKQKAISARAADAPRTRSQTRSPQRGILQETAGNRVVRPTMPAPTKPAFEKPALTRACTNGSQDSMPPLFAGPKNVRPLTNEPVASGIQRSMTSAVRSQMISSTAAAAPSNRVGTTKQMHQLQRQVLQRHHSYNNNNSTASTGTQGNAAFATTSAGNSISSSYANDLRAAINKDSQITSQSNDHPRPMKRKAAEALDKIDEEDDNEDRSSNEQATEDEETRGATDEGEEDVEDSANETDTDELSSPQKPSRQISRSQPANRQIRKPVSPSRRSAALSKGNSAKAPEARKQQLRPQKKPDPKPGYCENCRDKYDDFFEHIESRKHRRFAADVVNFRELDNLLRILKRR